MSEPCPYRISPASAAYAEGRAAASPLDNPYWTNWPKPSRNGLGDEVDARFWFDGWASRKRPPEAA